MKDKKINSYLKYFNVKFIIEFFWILIFCGVCSFFNINKRVYILFNDMLYIAIMIMYIYGIIEIIIVVKAQKGTLKFILLNNSILLLIKILCIFLYILDFDFRYNIVIYAIQDTLEFLQIGIIFKINSIMNKAKYIILFYYLQILSIVCMIGQRFDNYSRKIIWEMYLGINFIMNIIVLFIIIKEAVKVKNIFMNKVLKVNLLYMFTVMCNYAYFFAFIYDRDIIMLIFLSLKIVGFYRFYNKIIFVISKYYMEIANIRTKEINQIIKRRNIILNEINTMIQKGEDKYNNLVDCIYDGVFLFHLGKLQYMNKNALELLQIDDKKDILGMELSKFIDKYSNNKNDKRNYESVISKINGKDKNKEMFLIDVDTYNKILYIHDISDLNENKKLKEELEEYLKVDEIKKKFFANISHEFKTPINVIFSALQVNDIHIKDNNLKGIAKNSKIIKQNCLRLIRTINNFIDANKISEGYITPNLKVYNIVEIIENTANLCNKYINQFDNTLIFDSEEEEIYVLCDKEMIMTIILNIISNSVKYSIKGGWIKIYIEICDEESINVKIKNNGLKIDPNTVPYIFDKFTKLNKAFNRLREGSGLGLFLTKGLVELQNGKIRLISSEEGNEFIIEFPKLKDNEYVLDRREEEEELQLNELEEKVDIEFSDIYLE